MPSLVFLGLANLASIVMAQSIGTFTPTGSMTTPRDGHTATLLPGGKVLIAGGEVSTNLGKPTTVLASAELYDPIAGTFSPTGNMTTPRRGHAAALLADGRVLIVGGDALGSAELYDPATGNFSPTGAMTTARAFHTATLLNDGRVLITGDRSAELYDPSAGVFMPAAPYVGGVICDFCSPATLLTDGKTLFTGQQPAQLFDPVSGNFSRTGAMIEFDHSTATLLIDGKVLFTGGEGLGRSSSAELYDPVTGTFASTHNMSTPRVWQTATLLPGGLVLVAGGEIDACAGNSCIFAGSTASAELYDPLIGIFTATGDMTARRELQQATLLNDGRVLITGGLYYGGIGIFFGSLSSAELYVPSLLTPAQVATDLRIDQTTLAAGASYSLNISGSSLTPQTFFDVRFIGPAKTLSDVVLNWQKGVAAVHDVPSDTASGIWRINGVRAHEIETDHSGAFVPISATITVTP